MREILFRGKRIDKGDWVEGSLVVAGDYCCILPVDENSVHPTEYPYLNPEIGTIDGHLFPVDPSTVGQFTGLTDKNGKKIFEGNIVEYNGSNHKVVFENRFNNARFGIVMDKYETWDFGMTTPPDLMTVLGNIHDNPELLEVNDGNDTH